MHALDIRSKTCSSMKSLKMGKSPNTSLSFRYNANNEELEELYDVCEDDPPTPQFDASPVVRSENASPKRGDKTSSILDKYFKSIRTPDKVAQDKEKQDNQEEKSTEGKNSDENKSPPKEVTSSPMKEYLNRFGKKSVSESSDVKDKDVGNNETWKIFHDFKFKIAQAVEDMKTRSLEESKEKSVPRDNSISDSEENSAIKDSDQSVGDTDNQVSSLNSSIQNLSELTQPLTAKATEQEMSLPLDDKNNSDSSDDTQKNLGISEPAELTKQFIAETYIMEVESGVEALEDVIDGFSDIPSPIVGSLKDTGAIPPLTTMPSVILPPLKDDFKIVDEKPKTYFFTFTLYAITFIVMLSYIIFPNWTVWNGFIFGIFTFYLVSHFKQWFFENYFGVWGVRHATSMTHLKPTTSHPTSYTIPSVKEHRPLKKYEGWINHFRYPEYDPFIYSINKTTTAFMKLEGCNLRLSYTKTKIPKRALWDEKIEKVEFYQHRLYNLAGATVSILPQGLVARRHWSKKYPICIQLNENEKIQVLEKEGIAHEKKSHDLSAERKKENQSAQEMESAETNTSPEKKKKFIWRRKERSGSTAPHDHDVGREGLRHRLVRKMHREKKSDSLSIDPETPHQADKNTQPEDLMFHDAEGELREMRSKSTTSTREDPEEDEDETDISRLKEFLEETEQETGLDGSNEAEWSLHVKKSKDTHGCLFLFARTGRDKAEWYRRIMSAINEVKMSSAESSTAEEKSASDDNKDVIEMAVYKITDKETVNFSTKGGKTEERISTDGSLPASLPPQHPQLPTLESYDKTFWPFLLKIMQAKSAIPPCACHVLSSEVTWVNTLLARVVYDLTRNPDMLNNLQQRVQRKLATLKLPSFMSPLVVTELSLAGACPLVERVCEPGWDERGVWLDADLRYDGGAYISILTQINLMKLKEKNVTLEEQLQSTPSELLHSELETNFLSVSSTRRKAAVYQSDVEDSAESSDGDETPPLQPVHSTDTLAANNDLSTSAEHNTAGSSTKKFLRMVDKIATNKYFQQVTDYKYVKRAMEGLSNTDIKLRVELQGLEGRLAINLPPPPHDRVWIGFRSNPQLLLKARPAVGQRALRFAHISKWIEQKLSKEFEKILVLPNMEDFIVDIMAPTPLDFK